MVLLLIGMAVGGFGLGAVCQTRLCRRRLSRLLGDQHPVGAQSLTQQLAALDRAIDTARAQAASVARVQDRLRGVLEGFSAAVILYDDRDDVRAANRGGQRLISGRHGDALVMEAVRELLAEMAHNEAHAASRGVNLVGPPRRSYDLAVRRLDDGDRLVVVEDISERRRLEEVRRDFVANISHELKTPIGALALLAETMQTETMQAETDLEVLARLCQRLHIEALRVGSTVDDLLLLSRIEADDGPVREPIEVVAVVEEAVARMQQAAGAQGIDIKVELSEPDVDVLGDRRQLVSAVYNLLENAVKYSDPHSVVVVRSGAGEGEVVLEVIDSGMGIPAKDLERVFERFYRVDRARSRRTGGTGLGLAIVRHVAHNHGGSVRVSSREGEGSTFTLTLAAEDPQAPAGAQPPKLKQEVRR